MRIICVAGALVAFATGCSNIVDAQDEEAPFDTQDNLDEQGLYSCSERGDTGYKNGNSFHIDVVTVDGRPVETHTANAYIAMQAKAKRDGITLRVVSGFRTMDEQRYLYGCYVNGNCNGGNLAAQPGYSNHQSGHALDLNTSDGGVYSWLQNHGHQFGFSRTVPSEDWHWEWWGNNNDFQGPCGANATPPPPPPPPAPPPMHWFSGDFDGNGKRDLGKVWSHGGKIDSDIHLSDGDSFTMDRFANNQGSFYDSMHWIVGDFDGDHKDDLLDWFEDGGKLTVDVHVARGGHFDIKRFATKQGSVSSGM